VSVLLNELEALALTTPSALTALSSESVVIFLFAEHYLSKAFNWLDTTENPMDTISAADEERIHDLVSRAEYELMRPLIGVPFPYVTVNPPVGTLPCDGSTYVRSDYPLLYAALDPAFIVDADNFVTPDLRGRTIIGVSASYPMGATGGEAEHTLIVNEMPSHTHGYSHPEIPTLVFEPGEVPVSTIDLFPDVTSSAGGDQPHNNMQPYIALKYCMGAA